MTKYQNSNEAKQNLVNGRKKVTSRVELIGKLNDAREAKDPEAMIKVAVEYEQRGSLQDLQKAEGIRKEAKELRKK